MFRRQLIELMHSLESQLLNPGPLIGADHGGSRVRVYSFFSC